MISNINAALFQIIHSNNLFFPGLYRDRLKKSGINGMRALQEEVKLVRRKITQTINDLNKKSKNPIQQDSDTE